jgi:hypothetical protein
MTQPLLGVVVTGTSLVLGYAIFAIAVDVLGVQNVEFLLRVPIAVIFGTILVLNMCQNTVAAAAQPAKGAVNLAVAAVVGSVLLAAYQGIEPFVSGAIPAGPEALQRELFQVWTANALLAVTFPLLVFHAAFLDFWPLARRGGKEEAVVRT